MEPKEETLATIPEEEEDGDTVIPDVENNPKPTTKDNSSESSDASDSDSDSDSESEDEAKQSMELQTLQYRLSNEPSNYDTHVQVTLIHIFIEWFCGYPFACSSWVAIKMVFIFIFSVYKGFEKNGWDREVETS